MVRTGVITQDELTRGLGRHKFGPVKDFIKDAGSKVFMGVKKAANWTREKSDDLGEWIVGTETSGAEHDLRQKAKDLKENTKAVFTLFTNPKRFFLSG